MASSILVVVYVYVTVVGVEMIVICLTAMMSLAALVLISALESGMEFVLLGNKVGLNVAVHLDQSGWENAATYVDL